jgi:hypothetical protein
MAESVPIDEENNLSIERSQFLERRSHPQMLRIDRGVQKFDSIRLGCEV